MINKLTLFALLFLALGFASCKRGAVKPAGTGKVLVLTDVEQQKAVTDNSFTFKLFDNLAAANTGGDNLFISPLSASIDMAMTSNGASGQTLADIDNTMGFNGFTQDELNTYYNKLINYLPQLDPNTTLNIANSIWYRDGFSVLPKFISADSDYYKAKIQALNFDSPGAVQTINSWVSAQTNGKIPTIINNISSDEEMFLINALYFKSTWKESFNPANTKNLPFYPAGATIQASFMAGTIDINSYYDADKTVIELPYSNSKYSMVIVEPQLGKTVADILQGLNQSQWQSWMSSLKPVQQLITMPKFQFSYSTSLNDALTALGMGVAFSNNADFSLISPQHLQISEVKHKAYIAVDEIGTEAAAVTSVGATATDEPTVAPTYTINRPFIFAIREMGTGLILFTGIVNNPLLAGSQ
jgi:serpin B